jgi:two-component system sensor histidine kinase UhpB
VRRRALFTQVLVVNAVLLGAIAIVVGALAGLAAGEVVGIAVLAVVVGAAANAILLRRRFAPLEDLIDEMEKVDLARPGPLLPTSIDGVGETEEVERLELAFLRMMRRLEAERRRAGSAALAAQEEERARVARDLHDEVNQSLTGLLLRLEAARSAAPPQLERELSETKTLANQAMRELLDLARRLRPTALDDLGLAAAIAGLVDRLGEGEIEATIAVEGNFSDLVDDAQLVVYRVAQEALSNAARHSGAAHVAVALRHGPEEVELIVADDGRGFAFAESERGLGIGGMRERALLVGGELTIESRPDAGTTVSLTIPAESGS